MTSPVQHEEHPGKQKQGSAPCNRLHGVKRILVVNVKDGKVVQTVNGKTMWVNVDTTEQVKIDDDIKRRFKEIN